MTIAMNALANVASDADQASYATGSVAPAGDALILVAVENRRAAAGGATLPTLAGNGLTWVEIATQPFDDDGAETKRGRLTVFRSMGAAPSSGAITASFGGTTQLACIIHVVEFTGVVTTGANGADAVVQSAKNEGVGVSSLTVTLAAFAQAENGAYSAFAADVNVAINPDTGWTEINDDGTTAPISRLETQWRADNDTSAVGTMSAGGADMAGIALEIAAQVDTPSTPNNISTTIPTQRKETSAPRTTYGLGVNIYQPDISLSATPAINPRGQYLATFDPAVVQWRHEIHEAGGYFSGELTITGKLTEIQRWLRGLLYHVDLFDHAGVTRFEGFVNEIRLTVGTFELTIGPLLDIGNRVSGIYTPILDPTTDPPLTGATQPTTIAEETDSQKLYGIIEKVLDFGEREDAVAEQMRDTWLKQNAFPKRDSGDNVDVGSGELLASVNMQVLGWVHFLGVYVFNDTTIYTVTTESKIQTVLEADPNGVIASNYHYLDANGSLTSGYEDSNRFAWDIIKDVVAEGDVNDDRWKFGVYRDRIPFYELIPTDIQYRRMLFANENRVTAGIGTPVYPWQILPGYWIEYLDIATGDLATGDLPSAPNVDYIERVTFSAPNSAQIDGQKYNRLTQFLVKHGLGSI